MQKINKNETKYRKIVKKQKGITLIALVITIIVLIILASITIGAISGDNGILKNAGKAKEDTQTAEEKEAIEIAYYSVIADKDVSSTDLQIELGNNGFNTTVTDNEDGTLNIFFEDTKNNYKIEDGIVSETVLTKQNMNLKKGTIQTIDIQTNKIIKEEKVPILKTKASISNSATEVYFIDCGKNDPQQYLKDTYGIEEANIQNIAYDDNCLPVYKGNVGTVYYIVSQGNTYLNNEENGGGYRLFGAQVKLAAKKNLKKIDLTNLNTKYAVNMEEMFRFAGCDAENTGEYLEIIYGPNFDTSNVETMGYMYAQVGMKQIILPEKFNTKNVNNMQNMFFGQHIESPVEVIDLGENFDTSNVTNMGYMFLACGTNSLETLNLGGKFKIANGINIGFMFAGCGTNTLKEIIYEDTMENFRINCSKLIPLINDNEYTNGKPVIKCTDGNYEY